MEDNALINCYHENINTLFNFGAVNDVVSKLALGAGPFLDFWGSRLNLLGPCCNYS